MLRELSELVNAEIREARKLAEAVALLEAQPKSFPKFTTAAARF